MSPLPSPAPLRRTFLRLLFSPAGLLCGFVVLLITTCPGARGDDGFGLLALNGSLASVAGGGSASLALADAPTQSVSQQAGTGRTASPRFLGRSLTPSERGEKARASAATESFRHSRSALPLLVDPVSADTNRDAALRTVPMTGPAVGIRPKLPQSSRR